MEIVRDQHVFFVPLEKRIDEREDYYASMMGALTDHCALLTAALMRLPAQATVLTEMALRLVQTLQSGRKVLVAGNGGSAAEAQHFAAELVGRFKRERAPYPVIALTTDTAILTAVANDYGYQDVFARQVQALGCPDDMLTVFSTSGESENLLRAVQAGRSRGMFITALVGERQCRLARVADLTIQVPEVETSIIQELHTIVVHLLCDLVEEHLATTERQNCL
ncbi:MAG TPA: SIS domain-containing protein [Ktedonobacteraceae bacterium]|jgi:D-sedoheptulose 7-phosphate isomerase